MLGALFYLRVTSFRNWVLWRLRRLRQPKYLVGAVVAVAYFYYFFFRRVSTVRHGSRHAVQGIPTDAMPADWLPLALAIAAIALLVIVTFSWVVQTDRASLGFSEAEIAFLFPAPVSRQALVHFRLLSAQLRSLSGGLIMALVSNRWTMFGGNALTHALGWWFVFSALNLHFTGASFTLTRLSDRGLNVLLRRTLVVVAVAAVFGVTMWRVSAVGGDFLSLTQLAATAPLCWLLYPFQLVIAPFTAPNTGAFLAATGPALAVIGLQYIWVVKAVVSFEDATIVRAERRAARVAAWRSGGNPRSLPTAGRAAPFSLSGMGRPEIAFLWKNLLSTWPYFNVRVFAITAAVIAAATYWAKSHAQFRTASMSGAWVALIAGAYILIIGAQFARQDIRSDVRKLDILKTYPLAGWQIVLGELLTPAAILTGFVWLAALAFTMNVELHSAAPWLTSGLRVGGCVALWLVIPPIVMLQLLVPNAAALLFPSWFEATRTRGGGPEVMGQRMIFFFAQLVTIVVMLLPAALTGGLIAWLLQFLVGWPLAVVLASAPIALVLGAEVALGLWWLGSRFEKIDVAEELRA